MNYNKIRSLIEQWNWVLPYTVVNDEGQRIVIQLATDECDGQPLKYYLVYTYIDNHHIQVDRYYENGVHSQEIQLR